MCVKSRWKSKATNPSYAATVVDDVAADCFGLREVVAGNTGEAPEDAPRRENVNSVSKLGHVHVYVGRGVSGGRLECSVWAYPCTLSDHNQERSVELYGSCSETLLDLDEQLYGL